VTRVLSARPALRRQRAAASLTHAVRRASTELEKVLRAHCPHHGGSETTEAAA
jgi:hypothetical protein